MFKRRTNQVGRYIERRIDPDEIFLDSKNLPGFDRDQFEGRIESPISHISLFGIFFSFLFLAGTYLYQVANLQIVHGADYFKKSENNRLNHMPIFAVRGIVSDRNNVPLVWNSFNESSDGEVVQIENKGIENQKTNINATSTNKLASRSQLPERSYIKAPGFGHTLGYISYPKVDSKGNYYQKDYIGKDGIEEYYNELLTGKNGLRIVETDALGNLEEGQIIEESVSGTALKLSVDSLLQEKLFTTIRDTADTFGYLGGAGAIMDVESGELLAVTSYPEYDSEILSQGKDKKAIQRYNLDKRSVFLDRAISGVYTPGSIIKPFVAVAALTEGVITPQKQILSTGSISIQNPYYPQIKSVFNDWKAHGWTDMRRAIAVSSDVYFYAIGGGYEGQKGIGIANIEKYTRMFGFGSKTGIDMPDEKQGVIPNPTWKAKIFKGEPWRLGDTYNTSIGQYGFQTTVLQAVRGVAALTNGGRLVTPHLLIEPASDHPSLPVPVSAEYLKIAREGMRQAVTEGTVTGLNVPYVKVAGKTGTAEIDAGKKYINSWVVGFFPYEKPKYAFAIVMERGPYANTIGGVSIMRQVLDWMSVNKPEYLNGGE